jgi:putative membrane protein
MSMKPLGAEETLPRTDLLAIERTLLANERTFLAYFRTAAVFFTSGLAVLHIDFFSAIRSLAYILLGLSPLLLTLGVWRLIRVRNRVLTMVRGDQCGAK